jgi:Domain of unknown function (DUF4062)
MGKTRTIRLFLSSTFRDFGEERDLLVRQVFPALRARLKDRFVELVDVDLRWGITVEQAERGEVLPICLAEIDRARPYFIGMLGERYGWTPTAEGFAPDLIERQPWLKKHRGGKSVTELEILHGVLNNRRIKGRAFFYFRSASYARAKGGDYVPASAQDRLRQVNLKRRIKAGGYPVTAYRNPQALAKRLERDLWTLLDAEFPATSVPDAFEREAMRHEAYAVPRRWLYLGAERYQAALGLALESGEQRIVIEGASGGGKSALIANFFEGYRKRRPKHYIHEHYLVASADAGDPHALVRRLCEFIKRQTGSNENIAGDPQRLMDSLPSWLDIASAWARNRKTRFIFVLDALNNLIDQQDLRWWPALLPHGVQVVASCLQGPVLQALKMKGEGLEGQPPRWKVISVKPLTKTERKNLLTTYLARFNKTLPKELTAQVMAHPLSVNPLFIRTLAEELRLFGVHEELTKRLAHYLQSETVDDLFEKMIKRVEDDCGKKAVKATLTAIWASRAGLTEKEILGIANLKPATWAPIRNALDESLLDVGGRIMFSHYYLRKAILDLYLGGANPKNRLIRTLHRRLYRHFLPVVDPTSDCKFIGDVESRGMDVLYHVINSGDKDQFRRLVDQSDAFYRLVALPRLSRDWELIRHARDVFGWTERCESIDHTQRHESCERVLFAISKLFVGLFGRHMRYCAGEFDIWGAPVNVSRNELLGRASVVALAASARWWIIFAATDEGARKYSKHEPDVSGLIAVSKTGAIDDLDSYFAFLFKSRIKLLESFLGSLIGLSSSAEKIRMAVCRELVGWGELGVAKQLRSRAFGVDARSVGEPSS